MFYYFSKIWLSCFKHDWNICRFETAELKLIPTMGGSTIPHLHTVHLYLSDMPDSKNDRENNIFLLWLLGGRVAQSVVTGLWAVRSGVGIPAGKSFISSLWPHSLIVLFSGNQGGCFPQGKVDGL